MSKLFGTKEEARLSLRVISFIIIGEAIASVLAAIVSFVSGEMRNQAITALEGLEGLSLDASGIAQGITIGLLVTAIILGLFEIFIGYKGIREANGAKQGGGYLTLATVYLVIVVICLVPILINAMCTPNGFNDWFSIINPIAEVLLIIYFLGSAKTLRDGQKR